MKKVYVNKIGYLVVIVSLFIMPKIGYALFEPLPVSYYGHQTDAWFDKANPNGSLIDPFQNFQPGTEHYEWKDIEPHFHAIQGLGYVSFWYEAKDSDVNPQWHYVMNDFVGRTINLGGTLDNWFYWEGGGHSWGLKIFGEGNLDPLRVWEGVTLDMSGAWPVLDISGASRVYNSEILGAYKYAISPLSNQSHTIFELAIPYDIAPSIRDMIWFGDPLTSDEYYTYVVPAPSALLLLCSGLAGVVGLVRKRLLK